MGAKIILKIITRNHAAFPEIGILKESISKTYSRATAKSTAWTLKIMKKIM